MKLSDTCFQCSYKFYHSFDTFRVVKRNTHEIMIFLLSGFYAGSILTVSFDDGLANVTVEPI